MSANNNTVFARPRARFTSRFAKAGPAGKESGQSKPDVYLIEIKDGRVVVPTL